MIINKIKEFETLLLEVNKCTLCQRMKGRKKVLSDKNGNLNSKVMFIAEAPGMHGAGRTGIPLCGDQTGKNFEFLLKTISWERDDIFITNAVLCNPQNNATPNAIEIQNCSNFLKKTIELVYPEIIVTVGGKALNALKQIKQHNFELKNNVAQKLSWNNKILFPLYHMSPIVFNKMRSRQIKDFVSLSKIIDLGV